MDTSPTQTPQASQNKNRIIAPGVAYPVQTINDAIEDAKRIVSEVGTSKPISKEEISRILGKSVSTLSLFYSTLVQYGLFTLVHGKGYQPTELYRRYTQPGFDNAEVMAKLEMFKSPPLYAKIIEALNNHQLPSDEKRFANVLKGEPYSVSPNAADRASKIFFENARDLNLLDSQNTLKYSLESKAKGRIEIAPPLGEEVKSPAKIEIEDDGLFTLPIPLPGRRKAYLRYPLENLSRKDIIVIEKALEFIASSIDDEL